MPAVTTRLAALPIFLPTICKNQTDLITVRRCPQRSSFRYGDAFLNAAKKHMQGGSDDQVGYFATDVATGDSRTRRY
jgi:hypothetical protein